MLNRTRWYFYNGRTFLWTQRGSCQSVLRRSGVARTALACLVYLFLFAFLSICYKSCRNLSRLKYGDLNSECLPLKNQTIKYNRLRHHVPSIAGQRNSSCAPTWYSSPLNVEKQIRSFFGWVDWIIWCSSSATCRPLTAIGVDLIALLRLCTIC